MLETEKNKLSDLSFGLIVSFLTLREPKIGMNFRMEDGANQGKHHSPSKKITHRSVEISTTRSKDNNSASSGEKLPQNSKIFAWYSSNFYKEKYLIYHGVNSSPKSSNKPSWSRQDYSNLTWMDSLQPTHNPVWMDFQAPTKQ